MDYKEQAVNVVSTTWDTLLRRWARYGYSDEACSKRNTKALQHITSICEGMATEEESNERKKIDSIRAIIQEIVQLSQDLSIQPSVESYVETYDKTLCEQENELLASVEILRKEKAVRMARYDFLRSQELGLCEEMEEPIAVIPFVGIPHDDQVAELEAVVRKLNETKIRRTKEMEDLQSSIASLLKALEKLPGNDLERMAVGTPAPKLSTVNLENLRKLEETLQTKVDANEMEAETLWNKIRELWKRLKTDESYTTSFEKSVMGSKPSALKALKKELERCEEEKKANMKSFIMELRVELKEMWEKCFVSGEDQGAFFEIDSTDYSEELLQAHEAEVQKWNEFYDSNQKMIACIQRRALAWVKWLELEAIEDDPGRLANRGGALLKHEKEKKLAKKTLDKAESDIKRLNAEFVEVHGTHFTVRGMPVLDFIDDEKALAAEERLERKNMRKLQAEQTTAKTPTSRKRGLPATPSSKPTSSAKRGKIAPMPTFTRTPNQIAASRVLNVSNRRQALRKSRTKLRKVARAVYGNSTKLNPKTKPLGTSTPSNSSRFNIRGGGGVDVTDGDVISPASTYSEFTNHLMKTTGLSSSILQPLGSQNATRLAGGRRLAPSAQAKPFKMTAAASSSVLQNQF